MPQENNYELRLEELKKREAEIRQRLAEIANERTSSINEMADLYGVNATQVDLGPSDERRELQEELGRVISEQSEVFEARKQAKIAADKQRREERYAEINKNGKLQQAYKFFTYLDIGTTKGYSLNGLTEDDVLGLYDDFMTKPEYRQLKVETLEKAMRDDREIVIPQLKQVEKSEEGDAYSQLLTREEEIRQRLDQITAERNAKMGAAADLYGVSALDVDLGVSEEREQLKSELDSILNQKALLEGARSIDYVKKRKEADVERQKQRERDDLLAKAYRFFTYLDTGTTKGYNLNGLTEDDVLSLYDSFMTKPEYEKVRNETLEKAKKNDREIVIPELFKTEDDVLDSEQEEPIFSDDDINKINDLVDLNDLSPMMKNGDENKEDLAIVKYVKPDDVEDTPLDNISPDALETELEEPKPGLLKRAGAWIKNNKRKVAAIAGAAVVLGLAIGAVVYYLATNDPSALNTASQTDAGGVASYVGSQVSAYVDTETAKQATEAAAQVVTNADTTSIIDAISSAFKHGVGETFQLASTAYDAVGGNLLSIDPSVQPGVPVCGFDTVNHVYLSLESLKDMTPEQVKNVAVLMGDTDLSQLLHGLTDSNQINNTIASNISHAQGYTQIPDEVIRLFSQGGRVL